MPLTVFGAQGANNDVELWGTDGTTGRTFQITNINPSGSANVGNASVNSTVGNLPFAVIGNYAYFTATDGSTGQELWRTDGTAAGTTKVTEFSTNSGTAGDTSDDIVGYNPQNIVAANGYIFFVGSGPAAINPTTSPARYGIWRYDPGANTTVFVAENEGITNMISAGGRVYWTYDGASGSGLKSSDGVGAVESHYSLGFNGAPGALYDVDGTVYLAYNGGTKKTVGVTEYSVTGGPPGSPAGFIATSSHVYVIGQATNELFVTTTGSNVMTEITTAGLIFDFQFNGPGVHTPGFAALGDKLIFSNNRTTAGGVGGSTGSEVWISDGTAAGTTILKDIIAGSGSSNPHNFITVGSLVFFQATNGNGSVELWKTDGTEAGTVMVDTLFAGGISPGGGSIITTLNLDNMRVSDGMLYFSFDDQVHGSELWRSDGTASGTFMIRDVNTESFDQGFSGTSSSANLGANGVFVGWTQAAGYELFVTNGTSGSTGLLKDIAPGGGSSAPTQFAVAGTKAYFSAYSPTAGTELWVTDGTPAGTVMLKDLNPGLGSGNPSGMTAIGTKIYFTADNGVNGQELWVSDGTAAGTVLLKDIDATSSGGFPRSGSPSGFVAAGSNVFFTATTFADGRELWVTDGTAAGTHITKNIGPASSDANIYSTLLSYDNKVFFSAMDTSTNGIELWVSDGTDAGTVMLKNIAAGDSESSNPADFVLANGFFFFRAQSTGLGSEVYVSDGTVPGTVAVSATLSSVGTLAAAGNKVFFTGQGASGQELYVTSGGAATLIDIVPGASGSNAMNLVAFGTKVLFQAQDTVSNGTELWISDGTPGGTFMLKNINPLANQSSNPQYVTVVGNKAYFVANDGTNGQELWVTDGTLGGTVLVKNIGPADTGGSVFPLRAVDADHLLFVANDGTTGGQELWITDGTNAGTFRVTNVIQPAGSFFTGSGGTLNGGGAPGGTFTSVPGVTLGGGDETFLGTLDDDYFDGLGGSDVISGGAGNDTLIGGIGNDTLDGGTGTDLLTGGLGDDTYYVGAAGDVVQEAAGEGTDQVFTSVSYALGVSQHVETLRTTSIAGTDAINLTGSTLANTLLGNAGANTLNGSGGADTLTGFGGNDFYYVDNAGDIVQEAAGAGTDQVFTSVSYALGAGQHVEVLRTTSIAGITAINLTGNALANTLLGNNGANTLDGGGGADTLQGFGGNDFYYVDNAGDVVQEASGEGTDQVFTSVSYALGAGQHVEALRTTSIAGTDAINLAGNALANTLLGNAGANTLDGGGGNDTLEGFGGDDFYYVDAAGDIVEEAAGAGTDQVFTSVSYALGAGQHVEALRTTSMAGTDAINLTGNELANTLLGNAGANALNGLGGNDTLQGLGGADTFRFTTALGAGNVDTITGYVVADDAIQIDNAVFTGLAAGALAAGAFRTGAAAADADDRIIYNSATGALLFDADGNGAGAAVQFATLSTGLAMTAGEFFVI